MPETPREQFGDIDIYLFDQILRGRIQPGARVFDAGCGGGRNLVYFLKNGFDVVGVDTDSQAIAMLNRNTAGEFRAEAIENSSFPDASADVVLSSAVLHFARNDEHFLAMLSGSWRILRPGGLFFCRLASSIGMEGRVAAIGDNRFLLPDGSERYLVNEAAIFHYTHALGGELLDPIKTTIVQDLRAMTTWVMRRPG